MDRQVAETTRATEPQAIGEEPELAAHPGPRIYIIVAIVLSLPTAGPLLLQSLMSQDMYLAGAFVLLICTLTLVGSLISDILLALVDPRIRLE